MKRDPRPLIPDLSGRSSGILFHLTSLAGKHGSGDLGSEAYNFIEFLEKAGQVWWQMLPVGPPGNAPSFSPYDSVSSFAGSPWLVSLSGLHDEGLLTSREIKPLKGFTGSRVSYSSMVTYREERLRRAYRAFCSGKGEQSSGFLGFCEEKAGWLEDYALFMALRYESNGSPWTLWKNDIRARRPESMMKAGKNLADEKNWYRFIQYKFDSQWKAFRAKAHQAGIGLIGDLPIFAAHDSADVWSHQELFQLDKNGLPLRISGYPPDRFDKKGQRWGHPQYKWAAHQKTGFTWWVSRFERMFELFDALRIDHFLGFTRTWSIPYHTSGATKGKWASSPGESLFSAVRQKLGPRPMIAEDLGHVTQADIHLREKFGLAPMRIFQFGFGREVLSAIHLPHNYQNLCAAYTGNHDTNTIAGWFGKLPEGERRRVLNYTGGLPSTINMDSIRTLQASAANLVIIPLQDILGLGTRARMNIPGTLKGNWSWRIDSLPAADIAKKLRYQTRLFHRLPARPDIKSDEKYF